MIEFVMPSLGADMEDGTLTEWRVKPGDKVKRGDIIAEVDTQKGLIEIEVFDEGSIEKLLLDVGKKVPVGTVMALIKGEKETKTVSQTIPTGEKPVTKLTEILKQPAVEKTTTIKKEHVRASPLARKIAEEKGVDLTLVHGTGQDGAVTREDMENFTAGINTEAAGKKESSPAENIRMAIAAAMSRSNREIPHYYLETKIDMSASLAWLTAQNKKLSVKERLLPAAILIKAVAKAVEEVPEMNAWWINKPEIKSAVHVGFVVSLRTGGIIVPAIHDCHKKTTVELMQTLSDIIPRARVMKLRSSELSDSTITISYLGDEGADTVYGVIYPPQVALVGFGKISEQVCAVNGNAVVKPIINVTLSGDHRATDGNKGSKFLNAIKKYLEKPELV